MPLTNTKKPGARVTGLDRAALAEAAARDYKGGASIRDIAERTGRSYGATHRLLVEAGVTLRGRGGSRKPATA